MPIDAIDSGREGRIPHAMHRLRRPIWVLLPIVAALPIAGGCASMRRNVSNRDLRPCTDDYAYTRDGWRLGIRHYHPCRPDPAKLPVVLCHGLGLNATFWTLTDDHLPAQLTARGYEVFVFDFRASGENARVGWDARVNRFLRQTPLLERGERTWDIDDLVENDIPAILNYVERTTGHDRVNWIGHSLGGMMMFPYLELSPEAGRIANFVGMGSTIIQARTPQSKMLNANRGLCALLGVMSTGRLGRPLMYFRFPGLEKIDRFYYTASNVDRTTVSRFYGFALEDPGPGALRQLAPYLETGHLFSADGSIDYSARLGEIQTASLLIAGDGDIISDVPSTELTHGGLGSKDKTLLKFGKRNGALADYGHCDLVWSRQAPREVFPAIIDWLDQRQPVLPSAQTPLASPQLEGQPREGPLPLAGRGLQDRGDADLRPGFELVPAAPQR
jgi:pimeloyl-ACP methyl ester carboxylesterase